MTSPGSPGRRPHPYQVSSAQLPRGNYMYMHVVRPRTGQLGLPTSREVVLEHIVERKRMDDLAGSIMDGRFAEQKVWTTLTHSQILCEFFFCFL